MDIRPDGEVAYRMIITDKEHIKFDGIDKKPINFVDLSGEGYLNMLFTWFYKMTNHVVLFADIGDGKVKKIALKVDELAKSLGLAKENILAHKKRETVDAMLSARLKSDPQYRYHQSMRAQGLSPFDEVEWRGVISPCRVIPEAILEGLRRKEEKEDCSSFTYDSIWVDKKGQCVIQPDAKTIPIKTPSPSLISYLFGSTEEKEDTDALRKEHEGHFGKMEKGWTRDEDFVASYQAYRKNEIAKCKEIAEKRDVYSGGLAIIQRFLGPTAREEVYRTGQINDTMKRGLISKGFTEGKGGGIDMLSRMVNHNLEARPSLDDAITRFSGSLDSE